MAYNVEKKSYTFVCPGKISILSPEVWQKKNSYPNQITHNPRIPPPSPTSKVKWSVPNNPNETSHIPKQLLH